MTTYDGGPAFPTHIGYVKQGDQDGMTLRDYFAAAALQGLLANPEVRKDLMAQGWNSSNVTGMCVVKALEAADEMLAERKKGKKENL